MPDSFVLYLARTFGASVGYARWTTKPFAASLPSTPTRSYLLDTIKHAPLSDADIEKISQPEFRKPLDL
jgi:hypothetical protein